ncbi:hypothetical protein MHBO_002161 [Bonamia ostreae]|uniref:Uncharacterized protein n=1 Tax=Bonamia ostreae TaxID=126728 RepID=A0ABV2ALH9_9EUKA
MGLSRRLEVDQSEFNTAAKGSSGWQSPEVLCDGRKTKAIDIFSLGCIIFYILTNGHHPFDDDPLNRNFEVATNKDELPKGLLNLPQGCSVAPEAVHLVENMLKRDPDSRLRISDTLLHPFFWAEEKCLRFLCAVSNRFEKESADSAARALLESAAKQVLGDSWKCKIDKALISDVGRFRKYDFTKIKDLLRIIRNKAFHHNEIPKELKVLIGKYPNGFYNYFNIRFPRLLMYSYLAVGAVCSDEGAFAPFFGGVSDHYRKLLTKSARISVRDWYPWIFD